MAEAAATAKRPRRVSESDHETQEELLAEAEATLPPPGHARDETRKERADALEAEIDRISNAIVQGTVDASKMAQMDELTGQLDGLDVSNRQPGFEYGWVSKNNYGNNHFQKARMEGWEVVQGDDPEALELRGTDRVTPGGPPDSTRHLGDVILMRISRERYVILQARQRARTMQLHSAADSRLVSLAHSLRDKGVIIRPFDLDAGRASGPGQAYPSGQAAMGRLDRAMRTGELPGLHIQQN